MRTRLAIRIQECLDTLTPSERTLAAYVLDNEHQIVGLSAAELAREAGTSKSTTVRFFRTLGYESFEAVRLQARRELNERQPGNGYAPSFNEAKAGSAQAFLVEETTALARTLEALSSDTLRATVGRLASAERIWVLAPDDDAPLGPLIQNALLAVRGNVDLLFDGQTSLFTRLVSVGPRDTLLYVSLGQRSVDAKFAVERALSSGAKMIVLTNVSLASPVGSDIIIRCHAQSGMPDGSLVAAVSVIQFVARRLAARLGPRAATRRALVAGVRESARGR